MYLLCKDLLNTFFISQENLCVTKIAELPVNVFTVIMLSFVCFFLHLSDSQDHCVPASLSIFIAGEHILTNSSRLCCSFQDSKEALVAVFHIMLDAKSTARC